MRILLITYDFPPVRSPRALRWRYLARELLLLGHEVHVLCPDLGHMHVDFPQAPGQLVLHRGFPGPYGCLVRHSRNKRESLNSAHTALGSGQVAAEEPRLNWRGEVVDVIKRGCAWFMYPDIRAEWVPWARAKLRRLLRDTPPDVVITSHEPALSLPMGRWAQRKGLRWVADLGDPVCADYTPRRWRRRAWRLEAMVCRHADKILVTTEATRQLLIDRHQQDPARCDVLPNGYDDRCTMTSHDKSTLDFDSHRLELVHVGRLYPYRNPIPLLQALSRIDSVRLTLILPDPPAAALTDAIRACGNHVRVIGPLSHDEAMQAAHAADVLVNFGDNGQTVQVPAKVYEYLGVPRPVLHVVSSRLDSDPVAHLLQPLNRGWLCPGTPDELHALLKSLIELKQNEMLQDGKDVAPLAAYGHSALGRKLSEQLSALHAQGYAA